MEMLVDEARAGSSHAVARMASFVPRLEGVPSSEVPAAEPTMDDARYVYAREHGFPAWDELLLALQQIADGSREEPFVDFIHAVETGDTETVERHLDRDPDLVRYVGSTHKSALHSAANEELASLLISRGAPVDMECPLPGGTASDPCPSVGPGEKSRGDCRCGPCTGQPARCRRIGSGPTCSARCGWRMDPWLLRPEPGAPIIGPITAGFPLGAG